MTRIDVHFNIAASDKLSYCCRLIRKIYKAGQQVVVFDSSSSRLAAIDQALWTFSALDFIPHVAASDPLAEVTPVLLASQATETPRHPVLLNLNDEAPMFLGRFERLIDLVGDDPHELACGRARWRFYADRGYPIERHDAARMRAASTPAH